MTICAFKAFTSEVMYFLFSFESLQTERSNVPLPTQESRTESERRDVP